MKSGLSLYRKIFKEMKEGSIAPVYLLAGAEGYIMDELVNRLTAQVVPEDLRSFNLLVSYGAETDAGTFIASAHEYPFMAERKMLVLREMERMRGSWKHIVEYCRKPIDSSVVVLLFNTHDETGRKTTPPRDYRKVEAAVASTGSVIPFDKLTGRDLMQWVRSKGRRLGVDLDEELVGMLVDTVGENLYDICNELEKLSLVFGGKTLTRGDLAQVVGGYRLDALFRMIDGIEPGGEESVLRSISQIINTGAARPSVVLYHLIRHFLSLLKVKAGCRGGRFIFEKSRRKAGLFDAKQILVWLENLRQAELMLKSSSLPEELLCTSVVVHSMRGRYMSADGGVSSAA